MRLDFNTDITFTASSCYINKELLYRLAHAICDPDGYEYDYTIFDLEKRGIKQ
jgi:hypothetical protein